MGLLELIALTAGLATGSQLGLRYSALQTPRPFPHQLAALLDHPLRLRYRDPLETVGLFGIRPGSTVLDLGCGTGLITEEMARQVGQEGRVHAADIQAEMLKQARQRLSAAGLSGRVSFHHSGSYRLPLADNSLDLAVLVSTLSEIPDRDLALSELSRLIRPGGRIAVSEEALSPSYVPARIVRRWLRNSGFRYGGQQGTPFRYTLLYFAE